MVALKNITVSREVQNGFDILDYVDALPFVDSSRIACMVYP